MIVVRLIFREQSKRLKNHRISGRSWTSSAIKHKKSKVLLETVRFRQTLRPSFCQAFFPQFQAVSKAREGRHFVLGEQVARQSPKVSGCNPTQPSWEKAGVLTRSQESGGLAGSERPGLAGGALWTLSLHSTICSCCLPLAPKQHCQSLQGIAALSVSKTWERPHLTLGFPPWS